MSKNISLFENAAELCSAIQDELDEEAAAIDDDFDVDSFFLDSDDDEVIWEDTVSTETEKQRSAVGRISNEKIKSAKEKTPPSCLPERSRQEPAKVSKFLEMTSDLATLTPITRTHQTAKPSPDKCWKPESATVVKMLPSVLTNDESIQGVMPSTSVSTFMGDCRRPYQSADPLSTDTRNKDRLSTAANLFNLRDLDVKSRKRPNSIWEPISLGRKGRKCGLIKNPYPEVNIDEASFQAIITSVQSLSREITSTDSKSVHLSPEKNKDKRVDTTDWDASIKDSLNRFEKSIKQHSISGKEAHSKPGPKRSKSTPKMPRKDHDKLSKETHSESHPTGSKESKSDGIFDKNPRGSNALSFPTLPTTPEETGLQPIISNVHTVNTSEETGVQPSISNVHTVNAPEEPDLQPIISNVHTVNVPEEPGLQPIISNVHTVNAPEEIGLQTSISNVHTVNAPEEPGLQPIISNVHTVNVPEEPGLQPIISNVHTVNAPEEPGLQPIISNVHTVSEDLSGTVDPIEIQVLKNNTSMSISRPPVSTPKPIQKAIIKPLISNDRTVTEDINKAQQSTEVTALGSPQQSISKQKLPHLIPISQLAMPKPISIAQLNVPSCLEELLLNPIMAEGANDNQELREKPDVADHSTSSSHTGTEVHSLPETDDLAKVAKVMRLNRIILGGKEFYPGTNEVSTRPDAYSQSNVQSEEKPSSQTKTLNPTPSTGIGNADKALPTIRRHVQTEEMLSHNSYRVPNTRMTTQVPDNFNKETLPKDILSADCVHDMWIFGNLTQLLVSDTTGGPHTTRWATYHRGVYVDRLQKLAKKDLSTFRVCHINSLIEEIKSGPLSKDGMNIIQFYKSDLREIVTKDFDEHAFTYFEASMGFALEMCIICLEMRKNGMFLKFLNHFVEDHVATFPGPKKMSYSTKIEEVLEKMKKNFRYMANFGSCLLSYNIKNSISVNIKTHTERLNDSIDESVSKKSKYQKKTKTKKAIEFFLEKKSKSNRRKVQKSSLVDKLSQDVPPSSSHIANAAHVIQDSTTEEKVRKTSLVDKLIQDVPPSSSHIANAAHVIQDSTTEEKVRKTSLVDKLIQDVPPSPSHIANAADVTRDSSTEKKVRETSLVDKLSQDAPPSPSHIANAADVIQNSTTETVDDEDNSKVVCNSEEKNRSGSEFFSLFIDVCDLSTREESTGSDVLVINTNDSENRDFSRKRQDSNTKMGCTDESKLRSIEEEECRDCVAVSEASFRSFIHDLGKGLLELIHYKQCILCSQSRRQIKFFKFFNHILQDHFPVDIVDGQKLFYAKKMLALLVRRLKKEWPSKHHFGDCHPSMKTIKLLSMIINTYSDGLTQHETEEELKSDLQKIQRSAIEKHSTDLLTTKTYSISSQNSKKKMCKRPRNTVNANEVNIKSTQNSKKNMCTLPERPRKTVKANEVNIRSSSFTSVTNKTISTQENDKCEEGSPTCKSDSSTVRTMIENDEDKRKRKKDKAGDANEKILEILENARKEIEREAMKKREIAQLSHIIKPSRTYSNKTKLTEDPLKISSHPIIEIKKEEESPHLKFFNMRTYSKETPYHRVTRDTVNDHYNEVEDIPDNAQKELETGSNETVKKPVEKTISFLPTSSKDKDIVDQVTIENLFEDCPPDPNDIRTKPLPQYDHPEVKGDCIDLPIKCNTHRVNINYSLRATILFHPVRYDDSVADSSIWNDLGIQSIGKALYRADKRKADESPDRSSKKIRVEETLAEVVNLDVEPENQPFEIPDIKAEVIPVEESSFREERTMSCSKRFAIQNNCLQIIYDFLSDHCRDDMSRSDILECFKQQTCITEVDTQILDMILNEVKQVTSGTSLLGRTMKFFQDYFEYQEKRPSKVIRLNSAQCKELNTRLHMKKIVFNSMFSCKVSLDKLTLERARTEGILLSDDACSILQNTRKRRRSNSSTETAMSDIIDFVMRNVCT